MRQIGYYWVKYNDEWEVARFDSTQWGVVLHDVLVGDDFFQEIDERRIERWPDCEYTVSGKTISFNPLTEKERDRSAKIAKDIADLLNKK